MGGEATAERGARNARLLGLVESLAGDVGARRPTSRAERLAGELVAARLREAGLEPALEPFAGYSSFGHLYGTIAALGTAPALLPRSRRRLRGASAAAGALLLALEGGLERTPLSDLLARRASQNVVAVVEPRGPARRTVCLLAHLDTSRSGLLFHPAGAALLSRFLAAQAGAAVLLAAEPLLARSRPGRVALALARATSAIGLGLLVERELRGVDVPGANDNASGVAVAVELAVGVAREPLESTRVVLALTGCEESGLLGARALLDRHQTDDWLFLNFDSVGGPATVRFVLAEGHVRRWPADAGLVALAERVRRERPELGLEPAAGPVGLTYDATAVLARGGRALTFVAADRGVIPNYHLPSDTVEAIDPQAVATALAAGREMIARVDAGDADRARGRS